VEAKNIRGGSRKQNGKKEKGVFQRRRKTPLHQWGSGTQLEKGMAVKNVSQETKKRESGKLPSYLQGRNAQRIWPTKVGIVLRGKGDGKESVHYQTKTKFRRGSGAALRRAETRWQKL